MGSWKKKLKTKKPKTDSQLIFSGFVFFLGFETQDLDECRQLRFLGFEVLIIGFVFLSGWPSLWVLGFYHVLINKTQNLGVHPGLAPFLGFYKKTQNLYVLAGSRAGQAIRPSAPPVRPRGTAAPQHRKTYTY